MVGRALCGLLSVRAFVVKLSVPHRRVLPWLVLCALSAVPAVLSSQGTGAGRARPRFEGLWNSATATPLERPRELKDKAFFTPEEAAAWERQFATENEEPAP